MWKVLARTLKDELDAVKLGPEDEPTRSAEKDDAPTLGRKVPLLTKKIYALWKRNERMRVELEPIVERLEEQCAALSVAERNDAYEKGNALISAARKELLWHGMWLRVVELEYSGYTAGRWKVLARTLKDELDAVKFNPKDEPTRCVEDNDQLMRYGREVPLLKKVYALWKRNERTRAETEPVVTEFEKRYAALSVAERNDQYKKQRALISAGRKELLWHGMWWHVIEHEFPGHSRYYVDFCRGWQLVLVGETEER